MTDVDWPGFTRARTGICFKIGAEGSFGDAAQGKGCFLSPTNSPIYQMFVYAKSSSSSAQRPTVIVISPV